MHFEWDSDKAASNLAKHGFSFEFAIGIWAGDHIVLQRSAYKAAARWIALGMVGDVVLAVVFTRRGDVTRIISARAASRRERRRFHE